MLKRSNILKSCSALSRDRGGNFAMMAALVLPVLLAFGGVSMDMANMMMVRNQMQAATDAASLAASASLANDGVTQAQAKLTATEFLKTQMRNYASSNMTPEETAAFEQAMASNTTVAITEEKALLGSGKTFDVKVSTKFNLPLNGLTGLLGKKTAEIGTTSQSFSSTEAQNALSMFLVLDRSGSMQWKTNTVDTSTKSCYIYENSYWPNAKWNTPCYISKVSSLKTAVNSLLTQLKTADPLSMYVRTGAVSYNDKQDIAGALTWGTAGASTYVNLMSATGGTDSSGAFEAARKAVTSSSDNAAHKLKNGQLSPKKFIVFMTDGENNYYNNKSDDKKSDVATKESCDAAKDEDVEIYTVAFMAPTRGQNLLKYCATDASHYFEAEDSADLVEAFKVIGETASKLTVRLSK